MANALWVGTRKGLFALRGNEGRRDWKLVGPQFLGHVIHHVVQDPRDPKVVLKPGDTIAIEIEGLGRLENPVVA